MQFHNGTLRQRNESQCWQWLSLCILCHCLSQAMSIGQPVSGKVRRTRRVVEEPPSKPTKAPSLALGVSSVNGENDGSGGASLPKMSVAMAAEYFNNPLYDELKEEQDVSAKEGFFDVLGLSDFDALVSPTARPTFLPPAVPSIIPSEQPSGKPTISFEPTRTSQPSEPPTISPAPTVTFMPSDLPSDVPSGVPTSFATDYQSGLRDRVDEDGSPLLFTDKPTLSVEPTLSPTMSPVPSAPPTISPKPTESVSPSDAPSDSPSMVPSVEPTNSLMPSATPSDWPSSFPSISPSDVPSSTPTISPYPSSSPSPAPSSLPSDAPSSMPSSSPSPMPSSSPSSMPTMKPSATPSSAPSSSPTLTCHDKLDYKSPINGFVCEDHLGTSCINWRHIGLSLEQLEDLVTSCPVACEIDCGTFTLFDIKISYYLADVPGLLDANTVNDLNGISKKYLSSFVSLREPETTYVLDNVELLSQAVLNEESDGEKKTPVGGKVTLWITVAFRGFAVFLEEPKITERLVEGIDSNGYSYSIQNSPNSYLFNAYSYSAKEREESDTIATQIKDDHSGEGGNYSAAIVVLLVVVITISTFVFGTLFFRKKNGRRKLACPVRCWPRRKVVEQHVQSPESQNVASHVGSMFSFDDTATAGTNGLMRFISSFSRSRDSSTSPNSADSPNSASMNGNGEEQSHDEEIGELTIQFDNEEEEEEEPHPLSGIIPPMLVFDNIDDGGKDPFDLTTPPNARKRNPSVVPSRQIEASSSFIAALGDRNRPSSSLQFADFVREPHPPTIITDPSTLRWMRRFESRRPSPIGIMMDSDAEDDEVSSVTSTPLRLQESRTDSPTPLRRTRSLDDCSILDSVSDILVSEQEDPTPVSPMEPFSAMVLGKNIIDSPRKKSAGLLGSRNPSPAHSLDSSLERNESSSNINDDLLKDVHPRTPPEGRALRRVQSQKLGKHGVAPESAGIMQTFWNRSPIAKGVKEAIWSTKRSSTPTRPDPFAKRASAPATPTRPEFPRRRSCTPTGRRSSTPTAQAGRRAGTPPTNDGLLRRRSQSPSLRTFSKGSPKSDMSSSDFQQIEARNSFGSRSFSFSAGSGSNDEEVQYEFRAPRIGKLGLVIQSNRKSGAVVEQVKDYSTLFGHIRAGDRIVEVDGTETTHMSYKEITKRLNSKYGRRGSTELRIKVSRVRSRYGSDHSNAHSPGSSTAGSYLSCRQHDSDPEPLMNKDSLNSLRSSSYSRSNHGEEDGFLT